MNLNNLTQSKLHGPDGSYILASSGSMKPDFAKLPKPTNDLKIIFTSRLPWFHRNCKHFGSHSFKINAFGEETSFKRARLCPGCMLDLFKNETIRCCLCGLSIIPGDSVALYGADSSAIKREYSKLTEDGSVIGCLRWDCCPSGGFFSGHWDGKEFVQAKF